SRSFVNLDIGITPQWFPEYGIDLGPAITPLPAAIGALRTNRGIYVRRFKRGLVLVNPSGKAATYSFTGGLSDVTPHGGGALPTSASTAGWGLRKRRVTGSVSVQGHTAEVLETG
ncbi:MAG TPA: hypothetical protein VE983_04875, partial [Solirubrobacteraceae bacterium]|nr:hypothetical protein [Solirubrobacteraceae bacterium]